VFDCYSWTPWSWVLRYNNPTRKVADEHYLAFGDPVPPWSSDYLMRIADPHLGHLNELQSQPQPARGLVLLQHSQRSAAPAASFIAETPLELYTAELHYSQRKFEQWEQEEAHLRIRLARRHNPGIINVVQPPTLCSLSPHHSFVFVPLTPHTHTHPQPCGFARGRNM